MGFISQIRSKFFSPVVEGIDTQSRVAFEQWHDALMRSPPYNDPKRLEPFGYKSFSQNDEDGILQEIFRRIGVLNRTFFEFGVQDGRQNNSLLLLLQGWRGLWAEPDAKACKAIRHHFRSHLVSGGLSLAQCRVTPENVEALIASCGADLDLLSIDIDGNDYWVWAAVSSKPRVVVCEYNATFRPPVSWVMQYNPVHCWDGSNYHGASLQSLFDLAGSKGYTLVGCCLAGANAFFVRNDLIGDKFPASGCSKLFNPPRYFVQKFLNCGQPTKSIGPHEVR